MNAKLRATALFVCSTTLVLSGCRTNGNNNQQQYGFEIVSEECRGTVALFQIPCACRALLDPSRTLT